MLARLVQGELPSTLDSAGRVFIDRDPSHFATILNWLRDGPPAAEAAAAAAGAPSLAALVAEAEFYSLDGLRDALLPADTAWRPGVAAALRAGLAAALRPWGPRAGLRDALTTVLTCAYGPAGGAAARGDCDGAARAARLPSATATVEAWARDVATHDGGVLVWTRRPGGGRAGTPGSPAVAASPVRPRSAEGGGTPSGAPGPQSVLLYTQLTQEAGIHGDAGECEFRVTHELAHAVSAAAATPERPLVAGAPPPLPPIAPSPTRTTSACRGYTLPDGTGVAPSIVPVVRALTATALPSRDRALRAAVLELARDPRGAEAALTVAGFSRAVVTVAADASWPCDEDGVGGVGAGGGPPPAEDTFPSLPLTDVRVTVDLAL